MHGQQNLKFCDYVLFCVKRIVACVKMNTGFYLALDDVSVRCHAAADRTPILSLSSRCKNVRVCGFGIICKCYHMLTVYIMYNNIYVVHV